MSRTTVRPGQPFDAGAMATLLNDIIARGDSTAFTDPVTGHSLREWMAAGDVWHVAEAEGEVIGFQWLGPHPDLPEDTADVATFVAPGRHGIGTGSALWEATREAARARGWRFVVAVIRADNEAGLAYYGSRGFEDVDRLPRQRLGDGTIVDKVVKRIRL